MHVITIFAEKKAGILTRVILALARKGYKIHDQRITDDGPDDLSRITVKLDLGNTSPDSLKADIEMVSNDIQKVSIGGGQATQTQRPEPTQIDSIRSETIFADVCKSYPNMISLVRFYEDSLSEQLRPYSMQTLGEKVGAWNYQTNYALGSPLNLPATVKRMVFPEIKKFANANIQEMEIGIANCPFCKDRHTNRPQCQFVTGFILGFLEATPNIRGIRINHPDCIASGATQCRFTVHKT